MEPTAPAAACRRFLHTNYNCTDLGRLERWYTSVLGLKPVMRSTSPGANGEAFGIYDLTTSEVVFLYDHRGGRQATSLELVRWIDPPTAGKPYPYPWDHGVQAAGFAVPDLERATALATAEGGHLVGRTDSAALLRDPEGVAVELVPGGGEHAEAHHLRLVCRDIDASLAWYQQIGFAPVAQTATAAELWEGDSDHRLVREVGLSLGDDPTYSLVLTAWSGPAPVGPTYAMPFHQGLYRMALAVDDVEAAHAALQETGVARQPPYTFALPGTPITEGLRIMFIRDPDGVLVELVERPRSYFR